MNKFINGNGKVAHERAISIIPFAMICCIPSLNIVEFGAFVKFADNTDVLSIGHGKRNYITSARSLFARAKKWFFEWICSLRSSFRSILHKQSLTVNLTHLKYNNVVVFLI